MHREYGLIGESLAHSFSPAFFAEKFRREKINATYKAMELPVIDMLPELVARLPNLCGLNVTIPYKKSVLHFLDVVSADARAIGAVNCIAIDKNRKLHGHNTDSSAFAQTLKPLLAAQHSRAIILGTGGAATAVAYALDQLNIRHQHVSRTGPLRYDMLDAALLAGFSIIINTTPLGMFPDVSASPPIPYQLLTPQHLLYDLVYNPAETVFLKNGKAAGALVQNGYDMLVAQAEESWRIWQAAV